MDWLAREDLLTYEEIATVARVCVERFGFEGIRLTLGTMAGPELAANQSGELVRFTLPSAG